MPITTGLAHARRHDEPSARSGRAVGVRRSPGPSPERARRPAG